MHTSAHYSRPHCSPEPPISVAPNGAKFSSRGFIRVLSHRFAALRSCAALDALRACIAKPCSLRVPTGFCCIVCVAGYRSWFLVMHSITSPITSFISRASLVGFLGGRFCAYASCAASHVVFHLTATTPPCAVTTPLRGVGAVIRRAFPSATVRHPSALVRHLHATGGVLVAFPSTSCPVGLRPSRRFAGHGSGTWGAIALAVALGVPVAVFVSHPYRQWGQVVAPSVAALGPGLWSHFISSGSVHCPYATYPFSGSWFTFTPTAAATSVPLGSQVSLS